VRATVPQKTFLSPFLMTKASSSKGDNQACKLVVIVRLRDETIRFLPGCKLRPRAGEYIPSVITLKSWRWVLPGGVAASYE
jgi:hypothetical protein